LLIQDRTYAFKDDLGRFVPSELGIGLVEGYNVMGYQLNKASLRASMEKDCQAVARGQMQKEVMVRNCLTQMRECFKNCVQEAALLDAALGKYFQGIGHGPANQYQLVTRNVSACGVCHNGMDLKVQVQDNAVAAATRNSPSRFLFCDTCNAAHAVPKKGELSQHEDLCPICSFQVLTVLNVDTQKSHVICPGCFGNPPSEYSEPGVSGEFR
jgi:DNA topoisomerase III